MNFANYNNSDANVEELAMRQQEEVYQRYQSYAAAYAVQFTQDMNTFNAAFQSPSSNNNDNNNNNNNNNYNNSNNINNNSEINNNNTNSNSSYNQSQTQLNGEPAPVGSLGVIDEADYIFDTEKGGYFNPTTNFFYHSPSGYFFETKIGVYYYYDHNSQQYFKYEDNTPYDPNST